MSATNIVAHELESYGVRTFSAKEMAFNILGLMHPLLFSITQVEPIWADLNGGMDRLPDLADITNRIRLNLNKKSELLRAIAKDSSVDFKVINGVDAERLLQTVHVVPRANFRFDFPQLDEIQSLEDVSHLRGLIDLDKVIVVTGFAEVGPWGSSRTRWEMEARGHFTIEGCIEMAWMMGYIKHFDGRLKDGSLHVGWVDTKSGEPVDDKDVRGRYERDVLAHAGIRLIGQEGTLIDVQVLIHLLLQSQNCSMGTIPRRKCSIKRLSSLTTWRPLKSLKSRLPNLSMNTATNAISGLVRESSGLLKSRKALASWYRRRLNSVVP
jgi:fatty acid synthase subunit alpha